MKVGYARVSTDEQNLDLQEDALTKEGCTRIFKDKISSAKDARPGLTAALDYMREGDTLIIWKLDRLGRSVKQLINTVERLQSRNIQLKVLTQQIDTTTTAGKIFFYISSLMAEIERDTIRERTMAGLHAARARGRQGGRPKKMDKSKIAMAKQLKADPNISIKEICQILGVSVSTFYREVGK